MKKLFLINVVSFLCVALIGCTNDSQIVLPETTVVETEAMQEEPVFQFSLPNGYNCSYESSYSVIITKNMQTIGGILLTDLDVGCIHDSDCQHIHDYLRYFAPFPLRLEYIIMHQDNDAYISIKANDPETGEFYRQSHHLFEKNYAYFDFWVDTSVISNEESVTIYEAINSSITFK